MAAAVAALAAQEHARRMQEIVDAFLRAGATTPERARTLAALRVPHADAAESLRNAGVLVPGPAPASWYVDEAGLAAHRAAEAARHRPMAYVVGGAIGLVVVLGLTWWIKGG
jgi:hypothetical protein